MDISPRDFKRTKMVCTIGPASAEYETLLKMAREGMNIARINASHGDHAQHQGFIKNLRQVSQQIDKPIGILYDLQGPKIRLGVLPEKGVRLYPSQKVRLTTSADTGEKVLPIQFDFTPYLKKGDRIFINDGYVELKTLKVSPGEVEAKVVDGGQLTSHKGINLPDTVLPSVAITEKDKEDLDFALQAGVDFIAVSFVQSKEDILNVRRILQKKKRNLWIISKIERREALTHLEDIIDASDGIMIARGDLAIEAGMEEVPVIQRRIIAHCRKQHKPTITATQMLESMITSLRPTRAEVNDVATSVYLKVSAVMLSGETANGDHPVEVVQTMKRIIRRIERQIAFSQPELPENDKWQDHNSAVASASVLMAFRLKAELIIVGTTSGATAAAISAYRPNVPVIAVTHDPSVYRQLTLLWGVKSILVKKRTNTDDFIQQAVDLLEAKHYVKKGEDIVIASGTQTGMVGGTNMIKIHTVH